MALRFCYSFLTTQYLSHALHYSVSSRAFQYSVLSTLGVALQPPLLPVLSTLGVALQPHSLPSLHFQYHQLRVWRYSFYSFLLLITVSSVYSIIDFVCGAAVLLQFHYSFVLLITVSSVYSIIDFACGAAVSLQYHSCLVTLCVVLQFTCVALLFTIFSVCSIAFLTVSALQFTCDHEGTAMISGLGTSPIHFPGFEKNKLFHLRADLPHCWVFPEYFLNTCVIRIEI